MLPGRIAPVGELVLRTHGPTLDKKLPFVALIQSADLQFMIALDATTRANCHQVVVGMRDSRGVVTRSMLIGVVVAAIVVVVVVLAIVYSGGDGGGGTGGY